jgi:FkbH-like protein
MPRAVALIGSCFLDCWKLQERGKNVCVFDSFVVNHASTLPDPPSPNKQVLDYDIQIIQIPVRSFMPDAKLWRLPYLDSAAHQRAFDETCRWLATQLNLRMQWNITHGLLTFVSNFPVPQRNPLGSLLPRFDIRNPEHFITLLNEKLESLVRNYPNAFILDVDRICASFGRRYIQDDIVAVISHNAALGLPDTIRSRIETLPPMSEHYDVEWPQYLSDAIWAEIISMYRIVRQADTVKLLIVDLDDILWEGNSGDLEHFDAIMAEGWPLGLAEALMFLKKRGLLLAIVSKNDEERIRSIWPKIFGSRLLMEDFAAVKINWNPKADNVREILGLLNLLPRSVVFIDDNPAERASVESTFPDIRVLGRHPYYLRRILLWSSETQCVAISEESGRRTEMVQAQLVREQDRAGMSREQFLDVASPCVRTCWIGGTGNAGFTRAFELINKTNQFNTTGVRWTREELEEFFSSGGRLLVFNAHDVYTDYGLVGAVLIRGSAIEQWVMSCRVIGYDIERAVMSIAVRAIRAVGNAEVRGLLRETDANSNLPRSISSMWVSRTRPVVDVADRGGTGDSSPRDSVRNWRASRGPRRRHLNRKQLDLFG